MKAKRKVEPDGVARQADRRTGQGLKFPGAAVEWMVGPISTARSYFGGRSMYSQLATGTVVAGLPAAAAASGLAPVHLAVIVGTSTAGMAALVGLARYVHSSHLHRER